MVTKELANRIHERIKEIAAEYDPKDYSGSQLTYAMDKFAKMPVSRQNNWELEFDAATDRVVVFSRARGAYSDAGKTILRDHPEHMRELRDKDGTINAELRTEVVRRADAMRQNILGTIVGAGMATDRKSMTAEPQMDAYSTSFNSVDDLLLSLNALVRDPSQKIDLPSRSAGSTWPKYEARGHEKGR